MERAPIFHLCTAKGAHTMSRFRSALSRRIWSRVKVVLYDDAVSRVRWPRGVYLITDSEPCTEEQAGIARAVHRALAENTGQCAVLNDPERIVGRFHLLKELCTRGINEFDVHRVLSMPVDVRFPAFIRYEDRHIGPITETFATRTEIETAIERLSREGHPLERLMAVEFLDTSVDGVFTKYGAQKIGDHVFGKHLMVGRHWMMKRKSSVRELVAGRELEYATELPLRDQIEAVYSLSGHEWARMDYAVHKGRIQVWEINDNPELGTKWTRNFGRSAANRHVYRNYCEGLDRVSAPILSGPPMEFRVRLETHGPDVSSPMR
jgi:hypothetical protein